MNNGYMKTTGKDYKSKICTCMGCGEVFERERTDCSDDIIICPKCQSENIKIGQRTLASIKEEKENANG